MTTEQIARQFKRSLGEYTDSWVIIAKTIDGDILACCSVQNQEDANMINTVVHLLHSNGGVRPEVAS